MFTGLIEGRAPARELVIEGSGGRLRVSLPALDPGVEPWRVVPGESVAVSGCCLTAVEVGEVGELGEDGTMIFDLSAETLERTWFSEVEPGRLVNLERSMRIGDRLGGHLVSGHVDGVGVVAEIVDVGDGGRVFTFEVPGGFERYLIEKGSVCVDGISLTVVSPRERVFDVAVIPETLKRTSLGEAEVGDRVHLEGDMVGKWIERLVGERG